MNQKAFIDDFNKLCQRHKELAAVVVAYSYTTPEGIKCYGNTLVPIPPKDHEDEILRDVVAKEASELVAKLTKNVYL